MTAVDIFFVHRVLAVALLLTPVKNRRVEQNHLRLGKASKILLDHGLFASGIVMLCHPPQHPDDHGVAVLPVFTARMTSSSPRLWMLSSTAMLLLNRTRGLSARSPASRL